MEALEKELDIPIADLLVETFRSGKQCGLSVSNAKTERRVNLMLDLETKWPTVIYGREKDFFHDNGQHNPRTKAVDYRMSRASTVAGLCLDYLVGERLVWKTGGHEEESE